MGRVSVKKNKNPYQMAREGLGLSREKASELLKSMPPERIEKIESEKSLPHPDEVLVMAQGYKTPELCNYYCSNECPIGEKYVPELKPKELSQIVLEMIASLNSMRKKQDRLIEISADGMIEDDEVGDFVRIQEELEHISVTAQALKLWIEQRLADNAINTEVYNEHKNRK